MWILFIVDRGVRRFDARNRYYLILTAWNGHLEVGFVSRDDPVWSNIRGCKCRLHASLPDEDVGASLQVVG